MTKNDAEAESARPHIDYHQVGAQSTVYNEGKARLTKRVIIASLLIITIALFCVLEYTGIPQHHHDDPNDPLVQADYPRCTFDDLYSAFHPATKKFKRYDRSRAAGADAGSSSPQCWSLEEEILRVPAHAIHRHHLVRLGNGFRGAVYKAVVDLPNRQRCLAAVKTDHCNTPSSGFRKKQTRHSCLEPHSFFLNKDSYMAGEYTGAAMTYAIRHMKQQRNGTDYIRRAERGLLPTFGLIQDFGHPLWANHKRSQLKGYPHPDATVKGILMPLVDFEPLSSLSPPNERLLLQDARSIAAAMLPAAEGLQLVSGMRLSYRDVSEKNIGFVREADAVRSMIFDNSYVAIEDQQACMLPEHQKEGCNFCEDGVMYHTEPWMDGIQTDLVAFRSIVLMLLDRTSDASTEKVEFAENVGRCTTIQEMVKVLRAGP